MVARNFGRSGSVAAQATLPAILPLASLQASFADSVTLSTSVVSAVLPAAF